MSKKKVLLIAEAANPEVPSIPLVGWSHARALSELVDAHLITQIRTRDAILRAGLEEGKDFTAIDTSKILNPLFKTGELLRGGAGKNWTIFSAKGWSTHTAFSALGYYYFEYMVWKTFGKRIQQGEFDLVHRLIPLSPTVPSIIAKKCRKAGVPYIWGPINGGVPWPEGYEDIREKEREWITHFRPLYKLMPGYRSTRKYASAILIGSKFTWDEMPKKYHHKCVYIPENGIDIDHFASELERPISEPLKVAFVGRLVPLKGVDMLLEAATPFIRKNEMIVDIIGDGPELDRLQELAVRKKIVEGVLFSGWIEHNQLHHHLSQSDIFAFPSVRDFGGGVLVEAMALGLVPIVLDYAGPGELVTPHTGFLIPMGPKNDVIDNMRSIFQNLVSNPTIIKPMRHAARRRAEQSFSWKAKALQTYQVYDWVLGNKTEKPDFGMPLNDILP